MGVFRKNLITNDWVMFAPNRSARPIELGGKEEADQLDQLLARPVYKESCPFCPGNEDPESREPFRIGNDSNWDVRVLENKYASVNRSLEPKLVHKGLHAEMEGFGIHDVIIDNRRHNSTMALFSQEEARLLMLGYREHFNAVACREHIKHVVLFKNQGFKAGGSLEHPHSQIYGMPVVPFEAQVRRHEMQKYFEKNKSCLLGDLMRQELSERERILYENDDFVSWIPYAALSPYHIWIVPKRQAASFGSITDGELGSLADMMRHTFHMSFHALRNMDFNYVFQSSLSRADDDPASRWYISVINHKKRRGGIEFAGGLFVNPLMPEAAAARLREVQTKPKA